MHLGEYMILAAILLFALAVKQCTPAAAEWIRIDKFGGIVTDASAKNIPWDKARYAVGVYIYGGEIFNGNYSKRVGQSYVGTEPCNILGRLSHNNGILFDNGFLQWYDAAGDSSYIMQDTVVVGSDTARGVEFTALADTVGDLIQIKQLDTLMGKFALSNLQGLQITPVGGVLKYRPIRAIYSEKYIRFRDTGVVVPGTKYFIKIAGSTVGNHNVASLTYPDTTLFFNGNEMSVVTNSSIGLGSPYITVSPPDTGTIRYETASLVDTNQCGMLRFKGTAAQFKRAYVGRFLYPQDTSCVYRGAMFMVVRFDSGASGIFLCTLPDTTTKNRLMNLYKAATIRVQVFAKPTMELVKDDAFGVMMLEDYPIANADSGFQYAPTCSSYYSYNEIGNIVGTNILGTQ